MGITKNRPKAEFRHMLYERKKESRRDRWRIRRHHIHSSTMTLSVHLWTSRPEIALSLREVSGQELDGELGRERLFNRHVVEANIYLHQSVRGGNLPRPFTEVSLVPHGLWVVGGLSLNNLPHKRG